MNKILMFLSVAVFSAVATPAYAVLLAYDDFNYGAGASLNTQNGGTGWSGAWSVGSGSMLLSNPSSNLNYPTGYTSTGNSLNLTSGATATRFMTTSLNYATNTDYYMSFLVNKDTNGSFTVATSNGTNERWTFGYQSDENSYVGFGGFGTGTGAGSVQADQTWLFVMKFHASSSTSANTDSISLSRYKVGDTIPTADPGTYGITSYSTSGVTQDRIILNVTSGTIQFDEFRLGTSWADVVPVPEPSSMTLMLLGGLGVALLVRRKASTSNI